MQEKPEPAGAFVPEPGERLDSLGVHGWQIIQRADEFRFSIDAVLLAQFATIKPACRAADLGAGTGAVAMLLLARGCREVTGFELEPRLAAMAGRSAELNGLAGKLRVINGDICAMKTLHPAGVLDLVTANPPYRAGGSGRISPRAGIARACHEGSAGLTDFVGAAAYLLKGRGRLAMVHLPERLPDLFAAVRAAGLETKRLRLVQSLAGRSPKLVLLEAVRDARPGGLVVLPPLVLYRQPGVYSQEVLDYYR